MYIEEIEKNPYLSDTDPANMSLVEVVDSLAAKPVGELRTAKSINNVINEILYFPRPVDYKKLDIEHPISLDRMVEKQLANCYGFTILTSECFERAGIDHKVAFSNGHAFIVKPHDTGGLYMFDTPASRLNGEISGVVNSRGQAGPNRQVLETTAGLICDGKVVDYGRHPWLAASGMDVFGPRDNRRIFICLFDPLDGRRSIEYYSRFCESIGKGDNTQAAQYIQSMGNDGLYPDVDVLSKDKQVTSMLKSLVKEGRAGLAVETANIHFGALESATEDARSFAQHGDALRQIASQTKDLDVAHMASDCYRQAYQTSQHPTWDWLNSRMSKLDILVSEIKSRN